MKLSGFLALLASEGGCGTRARTVSSLRSYLARPQTVLADGPFTRGVAQRLLWGPRSIFHRCRAGISRGVRRRIRKACVAPGERQANAIAWPKFTNFNLGPGLNPGRHYLLIAAVALRHGVPMKVAREAGVSLMSLRTSAPAERESDAADSQKRRNDRSSPRGLSEGEHKMQRSHVEHSSPSSAAARVCEQRRGARRADEPGVAFLCLLSLAKQRKKVAAGQPPASHRSK